MNATADSPVKKKRPLLLRIALWGAGGLLVILLAVFLFLRSWLNSYLQSDSFRQLLGHLTSEQLRARCDYKPFHFSGLTIEDDAFTAEGTKEAAFSTLELDKIHTTISLARLWSRTLDVQDVTIQRLRVSLGHTAEPPVPDSEIGLEHPQPKAPSSGSSWLSPTVDLNKVVVNETDVLWGEKTPQAGSMIGTEVTAKPDGDAWNVVLQGGTISQKGGPDMKLDHIKVHYEAPLVTFSDGLLKFPEGGDIAVSGEVDPEKKLDVLVNIHDLPLKPFLPPSTQSKITGNVFADIKIDGPMPMNTLPVVSGSGHLENADLEGIPALDFIGKVIHSPSLRKIRLNTASAEFAYAANKVTISNLLVESKGLVSVTGGCTIDNSRINGTFEVGVPHDLIKWLPGFESKVFTRAHAGYQWATMHLTGPVSSPNNDLVARIELAIPEAALDTVTNTAKEIPKVTEEPKKVIDSVFKTIHK